MNLKSLEGKVLALAKRHGLKDINPRDGLKALSSRTHNTPLGKSTINNDDKSNDLVRLTPVGKTIVGFLEANPALRDELMAALGSTLALPPRWSPLGPREGAKITFTTTDPRPATYPAKLHIDAIFSCTCGRNVTNSYDMMWMEDNWNHAVAACPCGLRWRHALGEVFPLERA